MKRSLVRFSLRRLCDDKRGNVLAMTAIALPIVLGAVGLAVDTTEWVLAKRQMQSVADSAALSGSYEAIQGGDIDYAVDQDVTRRRSEFEGLTTIATLTPESRPGDPYAVQVVLTAPAPLTFSKLFLSKPVMISVKATATMIETNDFCAFALDRDAEGSITIAPNATVQADCGLASNSSARNAIIADASSTITAKKLFAFGGITASAQPNTRIRASALRQDDPLADVQPPPIPNTGCPNITINGDGARSKALNPGCFGNLVINGQVTLNAGSYVLNRGSLVIGPTADVTCAGCTFILTSENADTIPGSIGVAQIDPHATVQLSAPADGPYAGLLIYQDRRASPDLKDMTNSLAGNDRSKISGILYFPSQSVTLNGQSSPDVGCARIIGRKLILQGHLVIAKGCSTDTGAVSLRGAEVRLVG